MFQTSYLIPDGGVFGQLPAAPVTPRNKCSSSNTDFQVGKEKIINLVKLAGSLQNTISNQLQLYSNEVSQQLA